MLDRVYDEKLALFETFSAISTISSLLFERPPDEKSRQVSIGCATSMHIALTRDKPLYLACTHGFCGTYVRDDNSRTTVKYF